MPNTSASHHPAIFWLRIEAPGEGGLVVTDRFSEQDPKGSLPEFDRGVAGRSARALHDHLAYERGQKARARFGVFARVVLWLAGGEPSHIRAWSIGAKGEEIVGRHLDDLASRGVDTLHDRRRPRSLANIDHVAIAPSGIFVINTKHCTGARVRKEIKGSIFRPGPPQLLVGRHNRTNYVEEMDRELSAVYDALNGLPEARGVPVVPMLVLVGGDFGILQSPIYMGGVKIMNPKRMDKVVSVPGPLARETVRNIALRLSERLKPA
jgi:hypothetical protein